MTTPKPAAPTTNAEGHDQSRPSGRDEPMIDQLERALNDAMNLNRKLQEKYDTLQSDYDELAGLNMKSFKVISVSLRDITPAKIEDALNAPANGPYEKEPGYWEGNGDLYITLYNPDVLKAKAELRQAAQAARTKARDKLLSIFHGAENTELQETGT